MRLLINNLHPSATSKAQSWINDWPSHNHMRLPGLIALSWSVETSPRSCAASLQMAYDG